MKNKLLYLTVILLLFFVSCAPSHEVTECLPKNEHQANFWNGVWDGLIIWFSFIASLINDKYSVYNVNNNGHWYDFGFIGGFWATLRVILNLLLGNKNKK